LQEPTNVSYEFCFMAQNFCVDIVFTGLSTVRILLGRPGLECVLDETKWFQTRRNLGLFAIIYLKVN